MSKASEEPGIDEQAFAEPQRPKKKSQVRDAGAVKELSPMTRHTSDEEDERPRSEHVAALPWTLHKSETHLNRARESQHQDWNSSVAERIIAASQQLHKPDSHTVYGRPSKKPLGGVGLKACVDQWLNPTNSGGMTPAHDLTRLSETQHPRAQAPNPHDNTGAAAKASRPGLPPCRPKIAELVDLRTQTSKARSYHALATQLVPEKILQDQDKVGPSTQSQAARQGPAFKRFKPGASWEQSQLYPAAKHFKPWGQTDTQREPLLQQPQGSALPATTVDLSFGSQASSRMKTGKPTSFNDRLKLSDTWGHPEAQQQPLPQQRKTSAPPAIAADRDQENHTSSRPGSGKPVAIDDGVVLQNTWGQPMIQLSKGPNDLADVDEDLNEIAGERRRINLVPAQTATVDERFRVLRSNHAFREEFRADFRAKYQEQITACSLEGPSAWGFLFPDAYVDESNGRQKGLWQDIVSFYALRDTAADWKVVQHMQALLSHPRSGVYLSYPIRLLTRFLSSQHASSEEVAELLFPLVDHETTIKNVFMSKNVGYSVDTRTRLLYSNVHRYLLDLCREGCSVEEIVMHLRVVLRAARSLQLPLIDAPFREIIRHFCERSLITEAQIMFDEMLYYHNVQPTFLTRSLIVLGYARAGSWEIVFAQFEKLHKEGFSRSQMLGFSRLFSQVLREYLSRYPVVQMHDYLVHAMNYWGLVPTSEVYSVAMEAYLTQKRFDLARVLSYTARTSWPQIGFPTNHSVWHIGNTWERLRASCRDVEDACKAIFFQQHSSQFDRNLKVVAREALARDLNSRLSRIGSRGIVPDNRLTASSAANLETILDRAGAVWAEARRKEAIGEDTDQETREVIVQMESAERLTDLFNTDTRILDRVSAANVDIESGPRRSSLDPQGLDQPLDRFPKKLMQDQLPPLAELEHVLEQYYNRQAKVNGHVNHSVLLYLGWKLIRHGREPDLLQILSLISGSPFGRKPDGRPFDIHVLELWLMIVKQLRDASQCRLALEAAFDAGPLLRLTQYFMLLVHATINNVSSQRLKSKKWEDRNVYQELMWLAKTLHARLDARIAREQIGNPQWGRVRDKDVRGKGIRDVHFRPPRTLAPAEGQEANYVAAPFTQVR